MGAFVVTARPLRPRAASLLFRSYCRSAQARRLKRAPIDQGGRYGYDRAVRRAPHEWEAALAADGGAIHVAFAALVDDNERILAARSAGGGSWQVTPADPAPPGELAGNTRNNQWAPAIAAQNGEVAVSWVDFRKDNEAARVDDGGEGASYQLAPVIAAAGGGRVVVAWEDSRSGRRRIHAAAGAP